VGWLQTGPLRTSPIKCPPRGRRPALCRTSLLVAQPLWSGCFPWQRGACSRISSSGSRPCAGPARRWPPMQAGSRPCAGPAGPVQAAGPVQDQPVDGPVQAAGPVQDQPALCRQHGKGTTPMVRMFFLAAGPVQDQPVDGSSPGAGRPIAGPARKEGESCRTGLCKTWRGRVVFASRPCTGPGSTEREVALCRTKHHGRGELWPWPYAGPGG
jgi:hypothetical protein